MMRSLAWCVDILLCVFTAQAHSQVPPARAEIGQYKDLFAAALANSATEIKSLTAKGEKADVRDSYQRTPLHVATYFGKHDAMRALDHREMIRILEAAGAQ